MLIMRLSNGKYYACLLLTLCVVGCGNNAGNKESDAGSAISGLFGPSETEKANSKKRNDQVQQLQNQAQQMQKDRMGSY